MTVPEEYAAEMITVILRMTFTGSMISFFLFILKPIIKDKLSKTFQYYMWFFAVIALILPVSKIVVIPTSDQSVKPLELIYDITQQISDTAFEKLADIGNTQNNENEKNVRKITYFSDITVILFLFWQLGMILVLSINITCYVSYVRRLNKYNTINEQVRDFA